MKIAILVLSFISSTLALAAAPSTVGCGPLLSSNRLDTSTMSDEQILTLVGKYLSEGIHEGVVPDRGTPCTIRANYGMVLNVAGTEAGFQPYRDQGSAACMGWQACFNVVPFSTKVTSSQISEKSLSIGIETPRPEGFTMKGNMRITIDTHVDGKKLVKIEERVGLFHLFKTSVLCLLPAGK